MLKGGSRAMRIPAVDLHDQTRRAPEEIDYDRTHSDIHRRLRKPVATTDPEQASLKLGAGVIQSLFRTDRQSQELGLPESRRELDPRQHSPKIFEGALRAGYRNPALLGAVLSRERRRSVHKQATTLGSSAHPPHRDID
jgi:hypothetical protein